MVAYSFQKQFAGPILAGTKSQTIRLPRKRHARPGEDLQLFVGMRTKYCRRLASATCTSVLGIKIDLQEPCILVADRGWDVELDLEDFAAGDGFCSWDEMASFWRRHHPGVLVFQGVLIRWTDLVPAASANGGGGLADRDVL